jgi:hypothetical protein
VQVREASEREAAAVVAAGTKERVVIDVEPATGGPTSSDRQWYLTAAGRRRLVREARLLDGLGLRWRTHLLANGDLSVCFPRGGGRELVAVFPRDYPASAPVLLVRRWTQDRSHVAPVGNFGEWDSDSCLGDVVGAGLGPEIPASRDGRGQRSGQRDWRART